jgi:hypothetical protein
MMMIRADELERATIASALAYWRAALEREPRASEPLPDPCGFVDETLGTLQPAEIVSFVTREGLAASRYRVNSTDDSAEGMERLRSQREFILLADPADYTLGDLERQWIDDLDGGGERQEGFDYAAAEAAIRDYVKGNGEALQAALEARRRMIAAEAERAGVEELEEDYFAELPPFRLYVEDLESCP